MAMGFYSRFRRSWEMWLFRLILLATAAALVLVFTGRLNIYSVDVGGSGQFLLSAIVGSLSAILGIAFTLTLIGVQIAAQTYTHRIIRLHARSVVFIVTFGMFLAGIVFTAVLQAAYGSVNTESSHFLIDTAVVLFVCAVFLLVPFAVRTIRLLSPGNIAYALLGGLAVRHLRRNDTQAVHDRVGPVFDMARKAIISHDERTLELLLAQIAERANELAADPGLGPDGMKALVGVLGPEFRDLGWLASDHLAIGEVGLVVNACRDLVCRFGTQESFRPMADELYGAIKDIWKEALVRFSDRAYEARLVALKHAMAECQSQIAEVTGERGS